MTLVDPLPAGAMTFTGKTQGPAVNLGRARPHQIGGRMLYAHLDELRDWVVRAGWHTEKDYQILEAAYNEKMDLLADAGVRIDELEEKVAALERAFGWKPKEKPQNGKSQRSTEKRAAV